MNRLHRILLVIILAATALFYINALDNPFQFDDHQFIKQNLLTRELSSYLHVDWLKSFLHGSRLITAFTFSLNYAAHGLEVTGYHLVNVVLHLITISCVFFFIRMTVTKVLPGDRHSWIAPVVAALFALHPVQTSAVTYIVQRAEILSSLFYVITLLLLLRFTDTSGRRSWIYLGAGIVSFIIGWGSKEIIATLPIVYIIHVLYFGDRKSLARAGVVMFPVICAAAVFGVIEVSGFMSYHGVGFRMEDLRPHEYLFTEARVLMTYLRLIIFPLGQNLDYDYSVSTRLWDLDVLLSLGALLILCGASVAFLRVKGPRRSHFRLMGFGVLWFVLLLLPTSSIIPLRDVIFEHRIYLPMLGIILSIVAAVDMLIGMKQRIPSKGLFVLFTMVCIVLGGMTFQRNEIWEDSVRLWQDVVEKSPNKARPHMHLARSYQEKGIYDKALQEYEVSLRLSGDRTVDVFDILTNIGVIYSMMGQYDKALDVYMQALEQDPSAVGMMNNIAAIYLERGRPELALPYVEKAVYYKPRFFEARFNLGNVYFDLGRCSDALREYLVAYSLRREEHFVLVNVSGSLYCLGRDGEAQRYLQQYLALEPDQRKRERTVRVIEELKQEFQSPKD